MEYLITILFSNLWSLRNQKKNNMSPYSGSSQAKEQKPNIGYDSQGHSQKLVWRVDLATFRMMVGLPPDLAWQVSKEKYCSCLLYQLNQSFMI